MVLWWPFLSLGTKGQEVIDWGTHRDMLDTDWEGTVCQCDSVGES